ncbi:YkvA family protein [Actinoplanes sp. OR16]|uniref:YkvA family protein n=1 Tax=Actinoplanes sp. OR16 TaxID=946334 RepID=UPI000FD9A91A|nr:YkvA family protein [Actinoplanes sp. OR16]
MAKTLKRAAAFTALARALTAGARGGRPLSERIGALPRMIRATTRGEYDGGLRLAMMAAATAYVVSPIDAVPEAFLWVFGLVDDAVAVTWLAGAVLAETERFLEWERTNPRLVVK